MLNSMRLSQKQQSLFYARVSFADSFISCKVYVFRSLINYMPVSIFFSNNTFTKVSNFNEKSKEKKLGTLSPQVKLQGGY